MRHHSLNAVVFANTLYKTSKPSLLFTYAARVTLKPIEYPPLFYNFYAIKLKPWLGWKAQGGGDSSQPSPASLSLPPCVPHREACTKRLIWGDWRTEM